MIRFVWPVRCGMADFGIYTDAVPNEQMDKMWLKNDTSEQ